MATHTSVLAWRIPGTGEPGGLPSLGSHRVGHDWSDLALSMVITTNLEAYKVTPVIVGQASAYLGGSGKNLLPGSFRLFASTLCRCRSGGPLPCWKSHSASPLLLSIVTAALALILRLQIPLSSLLPPPCLNLVLWQPQKVLCFSERCVWSNYYWPQGMWGLISLSRDWTHTPALEAWRQVPCMIKWNPLR